MSMRTTGSRYRPVLPALLFVAAAGCAVNPVSGRPEFTVVSEAQEREMGEEEAKRVAAAMGLLDDAGLHAYVDAIGQRLAKHAPGGASYRFEFHVVDATEPNAFALPGGHVYVTRGLVVLLNSEAELAGVMGHEIGHVVARHAARRITRAAPIAIVTGLGSAVTGIVSPMLGDIVGGIGGLAGSLVLAPYSRGQESEADRVGEEMAAAAGWDPNGLPQALRALEREEALHADEKRPMAFFSTHPPLPDRVADTEARARTVARGSEKPLAATRAAFLERIDGLPIGARPSDGVVEGQTFQHPDLGFGLTFPSGWKVGNGRDAVGALAPDKDAVVALELAGDGTDPAAGLHAFESKSKVDLASGAERFTVHGLPAIRSTARARTRDGTLALDLTWIACRGHLYQLAGATHPDRAQKFAVDFRQTAASFHALDEAERDGFRESRLRTVTAKAADSVASLNTRAGGAWTAALAGVANDLDPNAPLRVGQSVKVARLEPYRPRSE